MGPSVKFVSGINGSFSKKKLWANFFKKDQTGERGVRGGFGNRPNFFRFFFSTLPLALSLEVGNKYYHWMLKIEYRNVAIFKTTIPMHGKNRLDGSKRKKQISLNYFHVIN